MKILATILILATSSIGQDPIMITDGSKLCEDFKKSSPIKIRVLDSKNKDYETYTFAYAVKKYPTFIVWKDKKPKAHGSISSFLEATVPTKKTYSWTINNTEQKDPLRTRLHLEQDHNLPMAWTNGLRLGQLWWLHDTHHELCPT